MSKFIPSILQILVLLLPALLMAWVLAVWLPGWTLGRWARLCLVALLSFMGHLFAGISLVASGWGSEPGFLTAIVRGISRSSGLYPLAFPLLTSVPVVAVAAVLLYFGGRTVRFRRSGAGVILGCVGAVLGFLLWIGATLMYFLLVDLFWTW